MTNNANVRQIIDCLRPNMYTLTICWQIDDNMGKLSLIIERRDLASNDNGS